jgi:hypothetical protein
VGIAAGGDPVLRADNELAVASVFDCSAYPRRERAASAGLSGAAASSTGAAAGTST